MLAFAGGFLAAYGAKIAKGCTSGQALTGGAILNVGSLVFMVSVFAGGLRARLVRPEGVDLMFPLVSHVEWSRRDGPRHRAWSSASGSASASSAPASAARAS